MSNKLTGTSKDRRNLENFVEKNGVVENAKAPDLNIEQVDVNIPSFGNRPTQPATIKSYLKSGGGFRPDLFEPVLIACVDMGLPLKRPLVPKNSFLARPLGLLDT